MGFVVSVYGFLISSRENRCLISLVAVLLTLAFAGQIFSLFTALQLRYVVSPETLPVGAATENMKLYNTDSTVRHNWDAMQRDLRTTFLTPAATTRSTSAASISRGGIRCGQISRYGGTAASRSCRSRSGTRCWWC